jgi:hypothetical protein
MTHYILHLVVYAVVWFSIGAAGWLFCMVGLWQEYDFSKLDQSDKNALYLMTLCGLISWYIILQLMVDDMRSGRKFHFKFPKYKSKGRKFLEKLES